MPKRRFDSSLPSRTRRPAVVRTYVRAPRPTILEGGGAAGDCGVYVVRRGVTAARDVHDRWLAQDPEEVRPDLGHLEGALGSLRGGPRSRATQTSSTRGDPHRAFTLLAQAPEGEAVRRRVE